MKYTIFSIIFMVIMALTSCYKVQDDSIIKSQEEMEVGVINSTESTSSNSGLLIFRKGDQSYFFNATVKNLETGKIQKYNTGESYPKNNTTVSVTGISPADMQASSNYQEFTLPNGAEAGTIDVCVSNKMSGSYISPFEGLITFKHSLTKVTFKAKRDYTMEQNKLVNNVKVTIPVAYLPTTWQWNNVSEVYEIKTTELATSPLAPIHGDALANINTEYIIKECYLMLPPGNRGILNGLKLEADLRKPSETSVEAEHKTWELTEGVQLYEDENGKVAVDEAIAGDAYEVVFNFTNDSFTLEARKQPWTKGGLITIPIDPAGGESKH